jgi:hypothetical protein
VTESPVWTPIGSTFSIEQTITTLSARSRMTSSSNSPQPITDWSISTWPIGEASSPRVTIVRKSSGVRAIPPPRPPSVKAGRTMQGRPMSGSASSAWRNPSSTSTEPARVTPAATAPASGTHPLAIALAGIRRPASRIAAANSSRSSAQLIAS